MDFSLLMTFVNEIGDKISLTISNIKQNVSQEEVSAAMDAIIANNIFNSKGGDFKTKYSAQLTQRQVTKWDLV